MARFIYMGKKTIMEVLQQANGNNGKFYIQENGKEAGHLTYNVNNDRMQLKHTEVDEAYRGKGYAEALVESAVAYARENQLTVEPVCRYANALIQRRKELQDVLV